MEDLRLPKQIEDVICNVPDEELARSFRSKLDFRYLPEMRDTFLEGLQGDVSPYEAQAENDPEEIVIRIDGTLPGGSYCQGLNIMLLDPWWSKNAEISHALAARVVDVWDEISQIAKEAAKKAA